MRDRVSPSGAGSLPVGTDELLDRFLRNKLYVRC